MSRLGSAAPPRRSGWRSSARSPGSERGPRPEGSTDLRRPGLPRAPDRLDEPAQHVVSGLRQPDDLAHDIPAGRVAISRGEAKVLPADLRELRGARLQQRLLEL